MKDLHLRAVNGLRPTEVEDPAPGPGEVLVVSE